MKRDYLLLGTGVVVGAAALAVTAPRLLLVGAAVAATTAALAWVARCRHRDGLGLLPASNNADGTRTPARWYCDSCGRSWPAGFERDRAPVVRFTGYDQSKLPAAARRADLLARQRQELAVRRAGLVTPRVEAPPVAVATFGERRSAR